MPLNIRDAAYDVFFLSPEIVLTFWGLLVVLVDVAWARQQSPEARRRWIGLLSLTGVGLGLLTACAVCFVPLLVRSDPNVERWWLSPRAVSYLVEADPVVFFGTIAGDIQSATFNVLYVVLLGLVVGLSMSWSFTEEWGEYFALLFWATVGMMLLTAAEELVTLFLTLETMTICLYLSTALEKTRRRSAEGGLKYFVYGSVSSALFLFGLSLVYGMTGTTQLDAIGRLLRTSGPAGLSGNIAGAMAILLMLVGFGFKVAAVPFHQWAPDAYEGAPAPVTALVATGSKLASFVAFMKVFLHALSPWAKPDTGILGPGWIGLIALVSAVTMTYGNFAALAQRNLKRMLAYSSIAHAGYILVGVAAVSVSMNGPAAAGAVLYYLVVYAFANVGAFAVAAWLVRDKDSDDIDDLNGLGFQEPLLATCILVLMLSLIGIPPLAGFFGKLYVFMEALNQRRELERVTLIWLVALGLFNSVVSAFYYVRVLKAMFLRPPGQKRLAAADRGIAVPIVLGTIVVVIFGIMPGSLMSVMQAAAMPMLTDPVKTPPPIPPGSLKPRPPVQLPPGARIAAPPAMGSSGNYADMMMKRAEAAPKKAAPPGKAAPAPKKSGGSPPINTPEKPSAAATKK
jgi:NADH-quinone oxidoreductase subunit N